MKTKLTPRQQMSSWSCRSESVRRSRVEWLPPTFRCNSSQRAVQSICWDAAVGGGWCFANALSWRPQSVGGAQTSLIRAGIVIPAASWAALLGGGRRKWWLTQPSCAGRPARELPLRSSSITDKNRRRLSRAEPGIFRKELLALGMPLVGRQEAVSGSLQLSSGQPADGN